MFFQLWPQPNLHLKDFKKEHVKYKLMMSIISDPSEVHLNINLPDWNFNESVVHR